MNWHKGEYKTFQSVIDQNLGALGNGSRLWYRLEEQWVFGRKTLYLHVAHNESQAVSQWIHAFAQAARLALIKTNHLEHDDNHYDHPDDVKDVVASHDFSFPLKPEASGAFS